MGIATCYAQLENQTKYRKQCFWTVKHRGQNIRSSWKKGEIEVNPAITLVYHLGAVSRTKSSKAGKKPEGLPELKNRVCSWEKSKCLKFARRDSRQEADTQKQLRDLRCIHLNCCLNADVYMHKVKLQNAWERTRKQ